MKLGSFVQVPEATGAGVTGAGVTGAGVTGAGVTGATGSVIPPPQIQQAWFAVPLPASQQSPKLQVGSNSSYQEQSSPKLSMKLGSFVQVPGGVGEGGVGVGLGPPPPPPDHKSM